MTCEGCANAARKVLSKLGGTSFFTNVTFLSSKEVLGFFLFASASLLDKLVLKQINIIEIRDIGNR